MISSEESNWRIISDWQIFGKARFPSRTKNPINFEKLSVQALDRTNTHLWGRNLKPRDRPSTQESHFVHKRESHMFGCIIIYKLNIRTKAGITHKVELI